MKPKTRIYYNLDKITIGQELSFNEADGHHIINVLRLKKDNLISIFNETNGEWLCKIISINKNKVKIHVENKIKNVYNLNKNIHLIYAPLKNNASNVLLEKITELGVSEITQVITERTTNNPLEIKKIQLKLKHATEQCGRFNIPSINSTIKLNTLLNTTKQNIIWLNQNMNGSILNLVLKKVNNIILLIGPEGGFSDKEQQLLEEHPLIINSYLPGNILKAETAGIVSVAISVYSN